MNSPLKTSKMPRSICRTPSSTGCNGCRSSAIFPLSGSHMEPHFSFIDSPRERNRCFKLSAFSPIFSFSPEMCSCILVQAEDTLSLIFSLAELTFSFKADHFSETHSFSCTAFSLILSQFLYSSTPTAIPAAMAMPQGPIAPIRALTPPTSFGTKVKMDPTPCMSLPPTIRIGPMYAAGGSLNSTVHLTMPEIERLTGYTDWVDICKGWQIEV